MGCKTIKLIVIAALLFPVTLGYAQSPQPNEKKAAPNEPVSSLKTLLRDPVSMLDFGLYKAQLDLAAELPDLNKRLRDHSSGPKWEERDRAKYEKSGWSHERIETCASPRPSTMTHTEDVRPLEMRSLFDIHLSRDRRPLNRDSATSGLTHH